MKMKTSLPAAPTQKVTKYLSFSLGNEIYAFPVLDVREIIRFSPITPVPSMPAHVLGVINLRGSVVPILDLRAKFALAQGKYGERACVIVVQVNKPSGGTCLLGALVDTVEEVLSLNQDEIKPAPDFGGAIETRYISGVATSGGGVKTLLHVDRIFLEAVLQELPSLSPSKISQGNTLHIQNFFVKGGALAPSPAPNLPSQK